MAHILAEHIGRQANDRTAISAMRGAQLFALIATVVASVALYLWRFDSFQVGVYIDDAQYIVLAKSIVEGPAYGLINWTGHVLPTRFPFAWSLLLAPVCALSECNFQALKSVAFAFTVANTLLIFFAWKWLGIPNRTLGVAVAVLYALSPMTAIFATMTMSEPAFLFFVMLGLILTIRLTSAELPHPILAIGLGIAWMFVLYVRTMGITFLLASLLALALRRKWTTILQTMLAMGIALALVVALSPVALSDLLNTNEYLNQLSNPTSWEQSTIATNLIERTGQGLVEYAFVHLLSALVPFSMGSQLLSWLGQFGTVILPLVASWVVLSLVVLGAIRNIKDTGILPIHLYTTAYLLVLSVWPWRLERFLYGVYPFLYTYLLVGGILVLQVISKHIGADERARRGLTAVGIGLFALVLLGQSIRSIRLDWSLERVRDLRVGSLWLKDNADLNALVVAQQPEAIYLYSKHSTADFPSSPQTLYDWATRQTVYVMIAPKLEWRYDGQLEHDPVLLPMKQAMQSGAVPSKLVFEDKPAKVHIYRIDPHN